MSDLNVSFTIPGWVLWALIGYVVVGVLAYLPLLAWMNKRTVSPVSPAFSGLNAVGWVVTVFAWPVALGQAARLPARRRSAQASFAAAMERAERERPYG